MVETYRFRFFKTVYVNFRLLPFRQAVHLPFVIYNKTQVKLSRSKLCLGVPPKFGLIKWGAQNDWQVSRHTSSLLMMVNGELHVSGSLIVAPGATVRVHEGRLSFGTGNFIGGGGKVLCNNDIAIGNDCMFAFGCVVCDTDFHYMIHDGVIRDCNGRIKVGDGCWVGNNTTIMRGCVLPSGTVVGSKSYANKDFSDIPPCSILVGTPAKLIKSDFKRVPSSAEGKLRKYFKASKDSYCSLELIKDT